MTRLRAVHDSGAFKPNLTRAELAEVHVPFSELSDQTPERVISEALVAGQSVGLVGPSGSGKSSLLASIDAGGDPARGRISLLYVPMATASIDRIGEPAQVATRVLAELDRVGGSDQRPRGRTTVAVGVSLPYVSAEIRHEFAEQAEGVDPDDIHQVGDAVTLALDRINTDDHATPLAFDDADRWVRGAGYVNIDGQRRRFFRMALRSIQEHVPYPVIVAVHPEYLENGDEVTEGVTDLLVRVPVLQRDGLGRLVETRLAEHGIDDAAEVVDAHALALLHGHYVGAGKQNLRAGFGALLQATVDGMNADADRVTPELLAPHLGGA